ncbi:MAG: hypothetical protein WCW47_01710 [Candidatus Paceibacterota bacterium]|jgi:tRNA A-37 threonylcarbamoyl transferase component Bud32
MSLSENGLAKIFKPDDDKNLGKQRTVYNVEGREGVDFIVKEKQSDEELLILRFLSESGITERLLAYDDKTLVIEKIKGELISDYLRGLIQNHSKKITITENGEPSEAHSRFRIDSVEHNYLPEEILVEDSKIREFYVDYVSKLISMALLGIHHNDIKSDHIFCENETGKTRFIDFGQSYTVGDNQYQPLDNYVEWGVYNIAQGFMLLQHLSPSYRQISENIRSNKSIEKLIKDLYEQFIVLNMDLKSRLIFISTWIQGGNLSRLLMECSVPPVLVPEISSSIDTLISKIQAS